MDYKSAGVDIDAGNETVRRIKGIAQSTLIEYAGATHGLLVTERERVTRDLLAFLAA